MNSRFGEGDKRGEVTGTVDNMNTFKCWTNFYLAILYNISKEIKSSFPCLFSKQKSSLPVIKIPAFSILLLNINNPTGPDSAAQEPAALLDFPALPFQLHPRGHPAVL
jgi:hypothetical protein